MTEVDLPKIENRQGVFHVHVPHVEIEVSKPPLKLEVTLRKLVTPMNEGNTLESITIDSQSQKLQRARREALELRALPERQRIRPLLEVLDRNIQYAFPWVIDELSQREPERAAWVNEFTGPKSTSFPLTLSEVIDGGYGVCRHLSVVLLALGKEAGLEGAHLTYHPRDDDTSGNITNVLRRDNGQPLFRSVGVGETFDIAHAWVEFKMSDGSWLPVDPTPKLVGDTPEGLETFREANYSVDLNMVVSAQSLPTETYGAPQPSLQFRAGESERTGLFFIGARRMYVPESTPSSGNDLFSPSKNRIENMSYQGLLDFNLKTHPTYKGTYTEIVNVSF